MPQQQQYRVLNKEEQLRIQQENKDKEEKAAAAAAKAEAERDLAAADEAARAETTRAEATEDEDEEDGVKRPGFSRSGSRGTESTVRRKKEKMNAHLRGKALDADIAAKQEGATTTDKKEAVKWRKIYNDWLTKNAAYAQGGEHSRTRGRDRYRAEGGSQVEGKV